MSEKCQRCGEEGDDRRTLWMACFYQMQELEVPFDEVMVKGIFHKKVGEEEISPAFPQFKAPIWKKSSEEENKYPFFTLRVCKSCRADWMGAIKNWFNNVPCTEDVGSGIFVRENGACIEISREEWDRRNPGREPVIYKPHEE